VAVIANANLKNDDIANQLDRMSTSGVLVVSEETRMKSEASDIPQSMPEFSISHPWKNQVLPDIFAVFESEI
jgi:hypothetical protein